jgi:hypothetical protein
MNSDDDTLAGGLPHSEIPGSPIARISPGLFAACHVLHRLSVPRHPPDALASRLITGASPKEDAAPPPRAGPKLHPREGGDPYAAASHEDTSSDTRTALLPHRVSASVTSQLSLFTLQSTSPPRIAPQRVACSSPSLMGNAQCRRCPMSKMPNVQNAQWLVEVNGIEPMTSCLQSRRSPN